ncbi:hypothetical protein KP509_39G015900 [Ceratopteris richardii]|uniref:Eukaryotic translation initiation factor 3 subunit J n=1 Tax=Ceratopteris richardii TaxID=49495 RepID=A0A8T2PZG1_CERRI|nr:hypothetical protein KP509_39G015900 [Ceratopteris richardii]
MFGHELLQNVTLFHLAESEDFVPLPPTIAKEQPKGQWDDEDADEEEDVKESWDDEEKPKPKPKPEKLLTSQKAKAEKTDTGITKILESKKPLTPEEEAAVKLEEKFKQQRLVEEADYQSTAELFGKSNGDNGLDNFIPKSESDFIEYAGLIAHKLKPFEKSYHYLTLLKTVMRHAMSCLKAADAREIASSVTVIANEKLKAEKEAAGKKKAGPKKKQLHVDKDDDAALAPYDDVDEYDFM